MLDRRTILKGAASLAASSVALASYAFAIEPMYRLRVQRYALTPKRWPAGLSLRIAVIADLHASEPQMPQARIRQIVDVANGLKPDLHLLLGDYVAAHRWVTRHIRPPEWSEALSGLAAPQGVHAVLGNHDWWNDNAAQRRGHGPIASRVALENHGVRVYENDALRLEKNGHGFWIAGLGDQLALFEQEHPGPAFPFSLPAGAGIATSGPSSTVSGKRGKRLVGVDDLPATLAKVTDDAPVILMAHEPDAFPDVPDRVALTISGHTHGGQVRILGFAPVVPSRYGRRFDYGHIVENGRHLIVSGGLGCSILPVRFGMPPEIVLIDIGGSAPSST